MTTTTFPAPVVATSGSTDPAAPLVVLLHGRGADEGGILGLADLLPAGPQYAAVRTPPQVRTSPPRSSRSTGAAFAYSPQSSRGSIHMTSNSLPSGSTP